MTHVIGVFTHLSNLLRNPITLVLFGFAFFCLISTPAKSQISYSYSINTGIPSNNLYTVTTDTSNLLWVASDNGLFTYNGFDFESMHINNNDVLNILYDNENRLWGVNSSGGLFYIKNKKVFSHENAPWMPKKLTSIITKMIALGDEVYIAHTNHLEIVRGSSVHTLKSPIPGLSYIKCLWTLNNKLYVMTTQKIYIVEEDNLVETNINFNINDFVDVLSLKNQVYFLTKSGVHKLDAQQYNLTLTKIIDDSYFDGYSDVRLYATKKELLIYKKNKLWKLDPDNKSISLFFNVNFKVNGVCEDRYGNVWITTAAKGLIQIPAAYRNIQVRQDFTTINSEISSFYDGYNNILGLTNGFISINGKDILYNVGDRCLVRSILPYKNGYLFGSDIGLYFLNSKTKEINTLSATAFKAVQVVGNTIYFADHSGMSVFEDLGLDGINTLPKRKIWDTRVYTFYAQPDSVVWVSTITGFKKITPKGITSFFVDNPSLEAACRYIFGCDDENLAIITGDNKIYFGNKLNGTTQLLFSFPDNIRINHAVYNKQQIWVATNIGIFKFLTSGANKDNFKIERAIIFDRLLFNSDIKYLQVDGDNISFINSDALYSFSDKNLKQRITSVPTLFSAKSSNEDLDLSEHLVLDYPKNNITLNWFDPSYSDLQYYYRLNAEKDDRWQKMAKNTLTLMDLQLGTSNIEIATSNGFDAPLKTGSIQLTVNGLIIYYKWFQIVLVSLVIGLVALSYNYIQNNQNRAFKLEQELLLSESRLKLTSLQSQMNPHFLRNCLNAIQSLINANNKHQASVFIVHFSELIDQFVKLSGQNFIVLEKEIKIVSSYVKLQQLRFSNSFEFQIQLDPNTPMHLEVPNMFLQPIIENAIEHGLIPSNNPKNILVFKTDYSDDVLTIEIIDNGVGIDLKRVKEKESIALNNIKKRINSINFFDDLKVEFHTFDNSGSNSLFKSGTTARIRIQYLYLSTEA